MEEYAQTAGQWIEGVEKHSGKQLGDPAKAAQVILRASESDNPPLRLALGPDALKYIREKHQVVEKDLNQWESLSASTNFDQTASA